MKRKLLLFLTVFSLLFTACGGAPTVFSSEGERWTMGFASMEIIPPDEPLNIAGYNQGVKITGVLDYQRASAVWMDTGGDGVLLIGVDLTRRMKRMRRRRAFAEEHGMDPFDIEGIDRAMADHESSGGLDGEAIVEDRFSGEPELRERRSKD